MGILSSAARKAVKVIGALPIVLFSVDALALSTTITGSPITSNGVTFTTASGGMNGGYGFGALSLGSLAADALNCSGDTLDMTLDTAIDISSIEISYSTNAGGVVIEFRNAGGLVTSYGPGIGTGTHSVTANNVTTIRFTDPVSGSCASNSGALDFKTINYVIHVPDTTPPSVNSIGVSGSPGAADSSVTFAVDFDENANNVSTDDFTVTTVSGTATGSVTSVSASSGDPINVTVSSISGTGSLRLDLKSSTNITDDSGNGNGTNGSVAAYTSGSTHTVDRDAPTITAVSIPNAAMNVGDAVTVTITAGEAGLSLNSGTVNGVAVTGFSDAGGGSYTATYTVAEGNTDRAAGADIPVSFVLDDAAGNSSATFTTAISQASDAIDANSPTITAVSIPNAAMNVGDAVTVTITAGEAGLSLNSGSVNGVAVTGFSDAGGGSYTATYTVAEGHTDRAAGDDIPVSFVVDDAAGNSSATFTTAISQASDPIDANTASITNVTIPNSAMKVGDAVTVSITASEAGLSLNTGTVNGVAVTGFSDDGGGSYTATYTVAEGNTDRAAGDNIPVNFILADGGGNNTSAYTTAIVQASDAIDANSPTVTAVSIPNTAMNVGDAVTVTITAGETGLSLNSGTVNGVAVTGFSDAGGGSYTATYTVAEGNTDRAAGADIPVSFVLDDAAGNSSATFTTAISQATDAIDANSPTISSVSVPANDTYVAGENLDFTVNFSESITDVGADSTLSITLDTGGTVNATVQSSTASSITYRYTVAVGNEDTNGISVNSISVGSGVQDAGGNALNTTLNSVGSTSSVLVDAVIATVTSVSVPANGSYKAGDNLDFTVNFSESVTDVSNDSTLTITLDTGGAVSAVRNSSTANSITYRYTIQAGNEDTNGIAVTSLNVGSGIQDGATNSINAALNSVGSTASVLVDTTAPDVSITAPSQSSEAFGITITFDESVTGFTSGEIGVTNGSVSAFTGSGTTYTATITPTVVGTDVVISVAGSVAQDAAGNNNTAATNATVITNNPGEVTISGNAVVGQVLTANVTDDDGIPGAITYMWSSDSATGTNANTYTIVDADVGGVVSVRVTYTDTNDFDEDVTSFDTATVITIKQNALNTISNEAMDGSGGGDPTQQDYSDAGVTGVDNAQVLALINNAVRLHGSSTDVDEDTELQVLVNAILEGQDGDGDGTPNIFEGDAGVDTDGDGVADRDDSDSDNDGISDRLELNVTLDDTDNDGIADIFDADVGNDAEIDAGKTDANFDGVIDEFDTVGEIIALITNDVDGDMIPDVADADDDGVLGTDIGSTDVAPANGIEDDKEDFAGLITAFYAMNVDNDLVPNYLDLDSDNDTLFDTVESSSDNRDADLDAQLDAGLLVITDEEDLLDTDTDSTPDYLDLMSDGVNFDILIHPDAGTLDANNDGEVDDSTDSDNDGIPDVSDDLDGFGADDDKDDDGVNDGEDIRVGDFPGDPDAKKNKSGAVNPVFIVLLLLAACVRQKKVLAMLALLMVAATGSADEGEFYFGQAIGFANYDPDLASGLDTTDDNDVVASIFLGYKFDESWSLELRYVDAGKAEVQDVTSIEYSSVGINAQYTLPWSSEGWHFYGLLGAHSLDVKGSDGIVLEEEDDVIAQLGVGTRYAVSERATWFVEYANLSDGVATLLTGFKVKFE